MDLLDSFDYPHRPLRDLVPDTTPLHQYSPPFLEVVGFQLVAFLHRLHGFRTRLHDEKVAGKTILSPFHVHRARNSPLGAVMIFDNTSPAGEGQDVIVRHGELAPLSQRHREILHHLATADIVDQLEFFRPEDFLQDGAMASLQRRLEDIVLIGIHRPLHDVFTQSVSRINQHGITKSSFGVDGEHHARGRQVRTYHPLHADRERYLEVIEALVGPVGDRSIGEQRCKTTFAMFQKREMALDVEVSLLLARETRVRQVFCSGAAPDRDIDRLSMAAA